MAKLKESVIGMPTGKVGQVAGVKWNGISVIRLNYFVPKAPTNIN